MELKKTLLCGNWKMKLAGKPSVELARQMKALREGLKNTEIWIAPSYTSLSAASAEIKGSPVKLGAQNVHWDTSGAFTGEVSVPMIKECGCEFSIVGHSERRNIFGETNELVAKRTVAGLKQGFTMIFCIGETLEQRKSGTTHKVLEDQMMPLMSQIGDKEAQSLVIAYEPVWAIGTGVAAQLSDIVDAHAAIAKIWTKKLGSSCPSILYGGSVAPDNFEGILEVPLVSGALIGTASLTQESMRALAEISEKKVAR